MKQFSEFVYKFALGLIVVLVLGGGTWVLVDNYEYIFSKTISGVVFKVERVSSGMTVLTGGSGNPSPQIFSFAVGIKDKNTGQIWTASSEDRQWAVVQEGLCVEAKFFPYPPWNFAKTGTYHGARLIRLFECAK